MSGSRITIADVARTGSLAAVLLSLPILVGKVASGALGGSERLKEGRPVLASIDRARDGTTGALDGTVALWGANLHNAFSDQAPAASVQVFTAIDAGTQVNFDTDAIPYAAFSNYNFIVIQDGVLLQQGASAGQYQVANNSGFARITLGTAAPAKSRVVVHLVTPVALVADAANEIVRAEVTGKTVVWCALTHASGNVSRTLAQLSALN